MHYRTANPLHPFTLDTRDRWRPDHGLRDIGLLTLAVERPKAT